jgi:hypothetical protein
MFFQILFIVYCILLFNIIYLRINNYNNNSMNVFIPKREKKVKRLFVPVTPSEHNKIMQYCKEKEVKLTDLIRFALKETFEL